MEVFSATKESLLVKTSEVEVSMERPSEEEQVFFGNDVYPCLVYFSKGNGKIRKQAVPLALRLKSYMGVVEYEKGMFMLLGGSDHTEQKASRSCYFYDKMKIKAYEALKMSAKRLHFASICHKNYVYVFGGYDCSKKRPMAGCERFNLIIDKW